TDSLTQSARLSRLLITVGSLSAAAYHQSWLIAGKGWNLYGVRVAASAEAIERRIGELRVALRHAVIAGDRSRATALRADLRQAERAWDKALAELADNTQLANPAFYRLC